MKLNKGIRDYKAEDYLWMKEGENCWVELDVDVLPDRDSDVFLPAKIKTINMETKLVIVDYESSSSQASPEVHITRVMMRDPQTYPDLHDLVDLPVLNDAELHQKIRDRFAQLSIFTYIGPSLLIINPFKYLTDQYKDDLKQEFYNCIMYPATNKVRDKPPHVWAIAASAYLELFINRINQACCVSGESGAGKTVNTKTCMSFLTGMNEIFGTKVAKEGEFKIEDKILMCNPILEALGNAKTVRNDNSSRFGKYVSLYIEGKIVVGASVESYLLEAIRVTSPNKSERNYHVFYQYLKGVKDSELSNMKLVRDPSQYPFLAKSGCFDVPTLDDVSDYKEHEKSMETLNLKGENRDAYWRIISAVLHLSQIKFDDSNYNGSNACQIVSKEAVENICHVLKVDKAFVEAALTTRTPIVMGKEMLVYLDKQACISQTEAFSKDIYSKLFNWVIKYLNIALLPEPEQLSGKNPASIYKKIGLLDIFGFEIFDLNSIEQLCINFTNEKLHQLYVEYVFKLEVQTFVEEGLKEFLANLTFKDNQEVIDTLAHPETKKYSIFNLIDDQSATMSKDLNLIDQFKQLHAKNPKVAFNKTKNNFFMIVHTARAVGYTIDGFCEKNKDEVPRPIIKCMLASGVPEITNIYNQKVRATDAPVDYLGETTKKKESFIGYKFRQQMEALMTELRSCQCSFMRCIKPNEQKSATVWTSNLVVLQIRYLGLLDSIKIRKESYPFRFSFKQFVLKYLELEPNHSSLTPTELDQISPNYAELSRNILLSALPSHSDKTQLIGKTRVFLKIEAFQDLERVYEEAVKAKKNAILNLDKLLLEVKLRNRIVDTRQKGFVACDILKLLLTDMKAKSNIKQFKSMRQAVLKLQAWFKKCNAQRKYKAKKEALMKIQQGINAFLTYTRQRERHKAAKRVFRYWKNSKVVSSMKFYVEILKRVRQLAYNAVSFALLKQQEKAVITIQSFYRGHMCRKRHQVEVKKIRAAIQNYRYQKAMATMKRYIGGRVVRMRIKKVMKSASVIQAYFKMIWTRHAYLNMKEKTIILQRAMRNYLFVKRVRDTKKLQYLKEEYIPFLRRCRADQAKLFESPGEADSNPVLSGREVKPVKKSSTKPFEQIPPVDSTLIARARILTEVIDLEFIEDVLPAYEGSWADGYMDACKDTRKNKSECRVIEVGRNHTVLGTSHGRCYTWGRNFENQLGCENEHDTMAVFRVIKGEEKLRSITVGEDCSYILTRDRTVFSFGCNENGNLGLGHQELRNQIELNTTLTQAKLKSIHSKRDRNYAVSETGQVLFWPVGPSDPRVGILRTPVSEKINTMSIGQDFAVLLAETGALYSFGTKNEVGQLGLGHFEPVLSPTIVKFVSKERVWNLSSGKAHTLCITKNNKIFGWGEGSHGQLGTGDCLNYNSPINVSIPSSSKPFQVCCSYYGSYGLFEDGSIFWWGRNSRVRRVVQPTVFRNLSNQELYPLQIRASWSSTMSVTYLEMADLRYLKDLSISLKHGFTKQMASKWNHMGNSQFELPSNANYSSILCSKNYEFNPKDAARDHQQPLTGFPVFTSIHHEEKPQVDLLSSNKKLQSDSKREYFEGKIQLESPTIKENSNRSRTAMDPTSFSPELGSPIRNKSRDLCVAEVSQLISRKQDSPKKTASDSASKSNYKSSVRREQERAEKGKIEVNLKAKNDQNTSIKHSHIEVMTKDGLADIKKTLKSLMLKPRGQWTKRETDLFVESNQSPLREKLKAIK